MKTKTTSQDNIFLLILGLSAICVFIAELKFANTQSNPSVAIPYKFLELGLSAAFGWILQGIYSRKEYQESLKQYAISAYRRISDIGKSVTRIGEVITLYRFSYPKETFHESDVIKTITEDIGDTVKSSKADWTDIIGEDLDKKEKIEELQQELITFRTQPNRSVDKNQQLQRLEELNKKLTTLESDLPSWLKSEYRVLDDSYPRDGRISETVIDYYVSEAKSHSCITLRVHPFNDVANKENIEKIMQDKPFSIMIDQSMSQ